MIGREGVNCMQIRDLEYKSGLDRATIRYYEKEGLIRPERHDNGYREYSQEHLSLLLKIKLLRQLGFSLEIIKELQKGTGDFDVFLKNQIELLESKIQQTERSKAVCMQIRNDKATYSKVMPTNVQMTRYTISWEIDAKNATTSK